MLKKQRLTAMEGKRHDAKPNYTRKPRRRCIESWWCQPCSQEVYSLRCKYCGKSEIEES